MYDFNKPKADLHFTNQTHAQKGPCGTRSRALPCCTLLNLSFIVFVLFVVLLSQYLIRGLSMPLRLLLENSLILYISFVSIFFIPLPLCIRKRSGTVQLICSTVKDQLSKSSMSIRSILLLLLIMILQ